ncbi:MAG: TonB-dependent receptor, partial [Acidobacteria bacterium]|nr:TonB-dependent receptor [Acidobacteriota bacterium]
MRRCVTWVVVLVLLAVPAFGQAVAEVNGSAADQTGSVLPGVTITITEETTGLVRTAISNDTGRFVLPAVTPGRYTVSAELAGFQGQARTGIVVAVGQAITLNFTLPIGTLTDQVTVSGSAPLIEVTQSQLGQNISQTDIENLPMQGREQFALLQLVPGLTPTLQPGSFEGAAYNANGRDTGSNLFLVDGQYNKDDRTMTFPQSRVTVDSMAEFQVLTHEYGAEYGGASGVIVNAITKSGTNQYHGRLFSYFQDESLNATNYFLKQAGEKNPNSGVKVYGGNMGGPIVKNKAFWFFNYEYNHSEEALNLSFPAAAAPLAVSFSDVYNVHLKNYFVRGDYQFSPSNTVHGTLIYGPNDGIGENAESERTTKEGFRHERAAPELLGSFHWTSVIGTRMVNEVKVGTTKEALWIGDGRMYNDQFNDVPFDIASRTWTGLRGVDPLDFGSAQQHPDYLAGPRASNPGGNDLTANVYSEQITYTPSNHTLKFGWAGSQNKGLSIVAANQIGTFEFLGNAPFNPAVVSTYPTRFRIRLGEMFIPINTWRTNAFVADKWQVGSRLTLNLGVRYDYDANTPNTKDGFAPRLGAVYAPNEKTAFRVGLGKFYEYPPTAIISNLYAGRVISPVFVFDTGEDTSPTRGVLPTNPCLLPQGRDGRAVMSPACRAQLVTAQNQLAAGGFINTEPVLEGNRRLGFLYQINAGVEREVFPGLAVIVDYVGSRGRDQTGRVDINEPRLLANGRIGRPGPAGFDPDGTRIPASARNANFQRVLEYTTGAAFNSDYNALEVSLDRRYANRWSGRLSYTLSKARDVNANAGTNGAAIVEKRVNDDLNPRLDYGLTNFDNRHTLSAGGNWNAWRDLGLGATFRYYSGNPVNETIGVDANGDRDGNNFDRPVRGVNDATLPIRSPLDANGMAIRNGLKGQEKMLLDLRLQYVQRVQGDQTVGLFWEIYNATNRANFANPTGNRRSSDFMRLITADEARSMQIGVRYT